MAYPPTVPPATRTDATVMATNHPSDHNLISAALTEILNHISVMENALYPIGVIVEWGGDVAPGNHTLCQGQAVSRSTNPEVFSLIGTKFGAGDGSTTFNMPNFCSRVPVGMWPGGSYGTVLGQIIGSSNAVLPSHQHGDAHGHGFSVYSDYTDIDHTHGVPLAGSSGFVVSGVGPSAGVGGGTSYAISPYTSYATQATNALNHRHSVNGATNTGPTVTDSAGVDGTNGNLQPSLAINFIMRMH